MHSLLRLFRLNPRPDWARFYKPSSEAGRLCAQSARNLARRKAYQARRAVYFVQNKDS